MDKVITISRQYGSGGREAIWCCKLYMPQYRGCQGQEVGVGG